MSVPYSLLGLLEHGPRHGYELKQQFDRWLSPARSLPFGQVYATLGRLEREGRVAIDAREQGEGPERKRYAITSEGREELDRWLRMPLAPEPHLQAVLFTKVALAALSGRPIQELLDAQRVAHLDRMRELTEIRRAGPLTMALLADYALFHLEADLRWLEMTSVRIDELRDQLRWDGGAREARS